MKGKANQAVGDVADDPERSLEGKRQEEHGETEQARADLEKERNRERS